MGSWRKRGLVVLAVLAAGASCLSLVVALQPGQYQVERSLTIQVPSAAVFVHVQDLKSWDNWSPWTKLDPDAQVTFSNPSAGKGASIAWVGNDQIGEGKMTILECKPTELVVLEQEFVRPMAGKARIQVILAPHGTDGGSTHATMRMDGSNNFMAKAVCLVMDMDGLIGDAFAQGLFNMKALAERKKGR